MLFPCIGLPISPGALPHTCALSSVSNLTNTPRGPSSRTVKDPPPFCGFPSVSQMSNVSWIWTGASFAGFSCSTWRSIVLMLWNPPPVLAGLLAVNCLQAWLTINRTVTGREALGRCGPPMTPKALLVDHPAPMQDISAQIRIRVRATPYLVRLTRNDRWA